MKRTWRAPGRVNLIGEHTDYNAGLVLPFAVPWGVTAKVTADPGDRVRVHSTRRPGEEVVVRLDELRPGAPGGWAAYAAGVVWALREGGHPVGGTTVRLDSDLPEGAGLSSSAALGCAVAGALNDLHGLGLSRADLVRVAQRSENDFVGAPTGVLDQSASLFGRAGHAVLIDTRDLSRTAVPFDLAAAGLRLLIIDTGVTHAHLTGGYGERRRECERAAAALGVAALSDLAEPASTGDAVLDRRVRHVVTENGRVRRVVELLRAGEAEGVGPMLTASHESLRDDYEVSWREADLVVEAVLAEGALGARMVGGGFGGSVIALAAEERVEAVGAVVRSVLGEDAPPVRVAVAGEGARRVE